MYKFNRKKLSNKDREELLKKMKRVTSDSKKKNIDVKSVISKELEQATASLYKLNEKELSRLDGAIKKAIDSIPTPKDGKTPTTEELTAIIKPILKKELESVNKRLSEFDGLIVSKDGKLLDLIKETAKGIIDGKPTQYYGGGLTYFYQIKDVPGKTPGTGPTYAGNEGKVLKVSADGKKLEFADEGGGASEFTDEFTELTDTPDDYTGDGEKFVKVNAGETGLEFVEVEVGDMLKDTYDPNSVEDDAFDMDNMSEASVAKTTIVDDDTFALWDSAASFISKKITWANIKTVLNSALEFVTGPESSTDNSIAVFDGTDSKTIKDGGKTIAQIESDIGDKTDQTEFDNHSARHEDGGDDEINVTGLSGELADPQPPQEHDNDAHSEDFATLDGAETLINKTISNYTTANSETIDLENLGSAETIDFDTNSSFRGTLNDDVTLTFSNVSNGQRGTITLYFSGSQRTITVAGANPPVGGLPDAPSSADEVLILTVWNDGTNTFIVGQLFDVS